MDARISEEQELLRQSARDFLERECPISLVRAQMDDPIGLPEALWKQMAELGWLGLVIDESHDGSGLGLVDVAVLLEEMGRVLCPGPFVSTAVAGALAIQWAGSPEQKRTLLPEIARGGLRLAFAQLEDEASWAASAVGLRAEPDGRGHRLTGRKRFVLDAPCANRLIVVARCQDAAQGLADDIGLFLVDPEAGGVETRTIAYNEETRKLGEVRFDGAIAEPLGDPRGAGPLLDRVLALARVATCAELCGSTQRVLELSVEYAGNREQFGQPIGRFQSIQHKCANMLVQTEGIRSAAYYAAWALEAEEPDALTMACLAKAYCGEAAAAVSAEGIQIHGGLGFTWEQDLHLYFKHARAAEFAWGDPTECREQAARDLIDVPAPL
ncbi:MAG: acyl-CoA/acyl-ACP dehydrogenase [Deltaproteobacteria bacterium]|nr:acyl-CoA/acyl-ACP dehydrogenase [Deltaproteobacteria bacterium]